MKTAIGLLVTLFFELREAVLSNRSNPDLFGDPGRFRKLED